MSYLSNLDALHEIFVEDGLPLWKLYRGQKASGGTIGKNKDITDLDESWEALNRRLTAYGSDGIFTVAFLGNWSTNNNGAQVHTLRLGSGLAATGAAGAGRGMIGGISDMIALTEWMDNRGGASIGDVVEETVAKVKQEFRIRELEDKLERAKKRDWTGKAIDQVLGQLPTLIKMIGGEQVALGEIGFDKPAEQLPTEPTEQPAQVEGAGVSNEMVSVDKLINDAHAIQLVLGIPVNELISKLRAFVEDNPKQAKMLISSL